MYISWLHNDKHNLYENLERNLSLNCHIKMNAYKDNRTTQFLTYEHKINFIQFWDILGYFLKVVNVGLSPMSLGDVSIYVP